MSKVKWAVVIIMVLFPVIGFLFYPYMPEQMGTHWGFGAEPDGYEDRAAGTFGSAALLVVISAFLLGMNLWLSGLTRKHYNSRKPVVMFDYFTLVVTVFFLVIYTAVLVWNAGVRFNMPVFIMVVCGAMMVLSTAVPIYLMVRKGEAGSRAVERSNVEYVSEAGEYRDGLVEIDGGKVTFRNYYFPAGDKTVELGEVEYVEAKEPTIGNGKWRMHGTGDLLFRVWFAADYERPSRDKIFVIKLRGKWVKIGFTVEDSRAVSEVFNKAGLLRERS
jgi:hypothetical protein